VETRPSPIQRTRSTGVGPTIRLPAPSVVVETTSFRFDRRPQIVTPTIARTAATLAAVANAAAAVGFAPRTRGVTRPLPWGSPRARVPSGQPAGGRRRGSPRG